MRNVLWIVAVLAACSSKREDKHEPAIVSGPAAVASCDYRSDVLDGKRHSCLEIFDTSAVDLHAGWCNEMKGPRDHPTFQRGQGCAAEGRRGGCVYPNGTIAWQYEGKPSCIGGLEFKDAPTLGTATPYHCATDRLCTEVMSVFDLGATVEKKNCETGGGTFAVGPCSANKVVGRCATRDRSRDTTWVYYGPALTPAQAKQHCETMPGAFSP